MSHRTGRRIVRIGPFHPLQEEPECFILYVDGELVVDIDMRISWNHRGIEQLSTTLTFDQVPFLVERVCGICSASHPLAYVRAVETIAGVEAPPRAKYIRTLVNELERIHSHLLWMGLAGHFIGYDTVFMWVWKYREPVLDLLEKLTGSRVNYANAKVGGVRFDLPDDIDGEVHRTMDELRSQVEMVINAVADDPVIHARTKNVGVLTEDDARRWCVTGPTARASNIPIDVRRDDPYGAYDELDWEVITLKDGDVFAKVLVRLLETIESTKLCKQAVDKMPGGPIETEVREIPPGEAIGRVEAPRGETFHYVRSNGTNKPERHKIRAPSYVNVPSFKASCIGQSISDVTITLAAVDPCYSCTERTIVACDARTRKEIMTFNDLVRLSREKTFELRGKL